MKRKVKVGNHEITYTLVIKKVKNINLKILPNGDVAVSCNEYVPVEKIDRMVEEKMQWILEKARQNIRRSRLLNCEDYFLYLGKQYLIQSISSSYTNVRFNKNICEVHYTEKKNVQEVLSGFEMDIAEKILIPKAKEVFEIMSNDYPFMMPVIKIRKMRGCWGNCVPKKNQITLNSSLIHYNERFIEYVIYHEFAHLVQPNHSKAFYRVIEKYMPDYKDVSKNGPNSILLNDEFVL